MGTRSLDTAALRWARRRREFWKLFVVGMCCTPDDTVSDGYDNYAGSMHVLVAGILNVETSVPVEEFPVAYRTTRFVDGVRSGVSGVGWNVALALHTLGSPVRLLGFVGDDPPGRLVRQAVAARGLDATLVTSPRTPESVVLFDRWGRRAIFGDLAGVPDLEMPASALDAAAPGCRVAVLANVDWTRRLLAPVRSRGIPIVTDLHDVSSLDNPYDRDYLEHADVVFLSHERLAARPEDVAAEIHRRHQTPMVVVGLGAGGALLSRPGAGPIEVPAASPRRVVSTTGAGDALLSAFVHFAFVKGREAQEALRAAAVFAGWKIGVAGGSEGFVDEAAVDRLLG
jgi:ribokinase